MSRPVTIYTDGSARGNPGPGGYGVVLLSGKHRKELSHGFRLTTNNRMELLSVIAGLEALKHKNCDVTVFSDSKYVVEAVEKGWLNEWVKKDFKKKKNKDLWLRFLKIYDHHNVNFVWIKGHSDNIENNRCDELAVEAALSPNLTSDIGYEDMREGTLF
ncbi:MAG: ribonuclease HI [Bacteroidota bacterium]